MTYPPPPGQPPYPPSPGEPLPPPVDPYASSQYTEPIHVQPGYGQPHYGPPGFVPPGYAQPTTPMAPPVPAPAGRSRTAAIALLSVAIALVVLVGGGVVFYLVGTKFAEDPNRDTNGVTAQGSASPGAAPSVAPSAAPSVPGPAPQDVISIKEPDTLNGKSKIETAEAASLTTDLEKELEGYPGAANAFGAVYGSPGDKKLVAALAAEVDIDDPQLMLDTMFQSFSGESQLAGVAPASTGTLGGVAQCGSAVVGKEDMAICGWADEGSVGMFLFLYETAVDVKGDFPGMRAEIETKD
ncbi:hypothetical protein [Actinoplanes sp. DH11]|uniref:hypothetical protein n=1 Tax=Actinoplanes sp. DH11 TaxID=2857011 RepID=UPI001E457DED|nr:hypothetical protein [Actinoplanes sp. DH11]